jgi:hypothetical protein
MSVRLQKSSSPRSEQPDSRHNQSFSPILNQLHADRGTLGSATTSSYPMRSSMLGSTPTLHQATVQVRNRVNTNSNPKALWLLASTPTRSAKSSWMVTCYTYAEATQDLKIFTCRTQQYVREYNYLNNGLRQPAYNYSNYSSTTASYSTATRHPAARALHQPRRAPRLPVTRLHRLYLTNAVHRNYSSPAARALRRPRRAQRLLVSGRTCYTSTSPCAATTRLQLHALYVNLAVRRGYSSPGRTGCSDLLCLRRASGCLGTSRGSSRDSSRRSSSTTLPHAGSSPTTPPRPGSSSTTSPMPRVRMPRHIARPVTRLIVDYSVHRDFALRPH